MSNPAKFLRAAFTDGNWSFRPVNDLAGFSGFDAYPKGERSHWSRRAEMRLASDGKTWMFNTFLSGKGRMDARPSFAEAKAEILQALNKGIAA